MWQRLTHGHDVASSTVSCRVRRRACNARCCKRAGLRSLPSCRRHAEAKGGVGSAAMCELPRAKLGREEVADHLRENL